MDSQILAKLLSGKHIGTNSKIFSFGDILKLSEQNSNVLFWVKKKHISKINFRNFNGIIISDSLIPEPITQIIVDNPRISFSKAISIVFPQQLNKDLLSQNSFIGSNVIIGKNLMLGQNVVIESDCVIGNNVKIDHNSVIKSHTKIGNNVNIGASTTIGGSGFGYEKDSQGKYKKIEHYGSVFIDDEVNIGDNVTIDRGTIGYTKICKNVKIDNQVHIAHNSFIGFNTIITAGVVVSGSVIVGENCWLGPNSTINNKASFPNNSKLGIGSVMLKKVINEGTYFGIPIKKA